MRIEVIEIVLLALLGVAVGAYGTLVGIGGGFVVVPLLLLVYKLPPPAAAATSLVVVVLNAASATTGYLRAGRVDVRTGLVLALATVPGALIGPFITERLPGPAYRAILGVFLAIMFVFLILRPEQTPQTPSQPAARGKWLRVHRTFTDRGGDSFNYSYSVPLALVISFLVGILSSTLGIGGGIVHVPAMIHLMSFPVHVATATSQFILAVTASAGVAEYAARGHVVWSLAVPLGIGAVVGAQLGVAISKRVHGRRIVRLLALAVLFLSLRLLWDSANR
ncbi:MAG: sulfite exporter TauE/SafE family protein [Gemmatimonadaceae bacterium]